MDTRYNRVALLKQAERRSQFVARIEKYEAKLRQEKKTRALLQQQQKVAMTSTSSEQSADMAGPKLKLSDRGKAVPENKVVQLRKEEHQENFTERKKSIQQCLDESEDSPQRKAVPERTEFPTKQSRIALLSKGKIVSTNGRGRDTPSCCSAEEIKSLAEGPFKPTAATELNLAVIAAARKIRVKAADMSASMQEHAFRCARETLDSLEKLHCKRVAFALKKEFDKNYGPAWHCIVGTSFGSYLTHSLGGFIYFSIDNVSVLLFKTTVEPLG